MHESTVEKTLDAQPIIPADTTAVDLHISTKTAVRITRHHHKQRRAYNDSIPRGPAGCPAGRYTENVFLSASRPGSKTLKKGRKSGRPLHHELRQDCANCPAGECGSSGRICYIRPGDWCMETGIVLRFGFVAAPPIFLHVAMCLKVTPSSKPDRTAVMCASQGISWTRGVRLTPNVFNAQVCLWGWKVGGRGILR